MQSPVSRRPGEAVFAALMVVVSLILFWNAYKISGFTALSSPGSFPLAATSAMVLASLVTLARTVAMPPEATGFAALRALVFPTVVVAFGALIILYGALLESLGFVLTSLAFLFGGIWLLHQRGPWVALFWAVVSIILVYVIFRLIFQVVLPEGILPERRILAVIGDMLWKGPAR